MGLSCWARARGEGDQTAGEEVARGLQIGGAGGDGRAVGGQSAGEGEAEGRHRNRAGHAEGPRRSEGAERSQEGSRMSLYAAMACTGHAWPCGLLALSMMSCSLRVTPGGVRHGPRRT